MRNIYKILLTSVIFLVSCSSPTLENASLGLNSRPAMWLATNGQSNVYLLGSVHILPAEVKWYTPKIKEAFESSEVLILENIHSEATKEKYLDYSKKHGLLPNGKIISDYISSDEYMKYQEIVTELALDRYYADRMKPWLFMLTVNGYITKESSKYGVDTLLEGEANKRHKHVKSLESIEEVLDSLSAVPLHKDVNKLKEVLSQNEVDAQALKNKIDLLISWTLGDIERTERLLSQSIAKAEYYNLIIKRNNKWYPKIKKELKSGRDTMIVVGLAHLIGTGNIIDKLKHQGYDVKRVQ